jgi:hypothetical protein
MSSKPKGKGNAEPHAISAQAAQTGEASVGNAERDKEIRLCAYEIYLERGEQPGRELDDWPPIRTRTRRWGACAGGLGS